jgi:hypothetical protein
VFGFLVSNILGDLTVTGSSAPYTNVWSVLNSGTAQPVTDTLTWYTGIPGSYGARQFAGACLSDLSVKFDVGKALLNYTAAGTAWGSVVAAAAPVNTFGGDTPMASWIGAVTLGGSTALYVQSGSFDIKRNLETIFTAQTSVQNPYIIQRGALSVTGSLVIIAADDTAMTNYLTNAQPSIDVNFSSGTGAALRQVKLHCSKAAYTKVTHDTATDAIQYTVDFTAVANTTDIGASGGYGPIQVTTQSSLASGSYQ